MTGDEHVSNKLDRWWSTNGKEDSAYMMRKEGRMIQFKGLGVSGPENVSFAFIFSYFFYSNSDLFRILTQGDRISSQ